MNTTGNHAGTAPRLAAIAVGIALLASCASDTSAGSTTTTSTTTTSDTTIAGTDTVDVAAGATYTISAGDTLSDIAARAGVSVADIVDANGWSDGSGHSIFPGDVIMLPLGASTPAPRPAAPATPSTSADSPATTTPAASTIPFDENGALACDGAALRDAIGDPDFVTFDEISCADGWAGAGYIDVDSVYRPVIFKAEGQRWVLQDWSTVCDLNPDMSPAAQLYCPGG